MLEELDTVPWASLQQPPWNTATAVPDAIRGLAVANTGEEARAAYDRFLYAVGNNHAGTYFPVVLRTLPFLEEILRSSLSRAHEPTLDVLIDLIGSFEPEPTHRVLTNDAGEKLELRKLVRAGVDGFSDIVGELARSGARGTRTPLLAEELLAVLAEPE